MICKSNGSLEEIDKYLTTICIDFIETHSEIDLINFSKSNFDVNSQKDIDIVYEVISKLVLKNAINSRSDIRQALEENFEKKPSTRIIFKDQNKKNSEISNDIAYSSNSNDSVVLSNEEVNFRYENKNEKSKPQISPNVNFSTKQNLIDPNSSHNITQTNRNKIDANQNPLTSLKDPTAITLLSAEKINSLINNFTQNFKYETNIFDNIKSSNYFNYTGDLNSSHNTISLMISKIFDEGNKNAINNNFYNDFNGINKSFTNFNNKDKIPINYCESNKNTNSSFVNNGLLKKLQTENNFGLFKSSLEKLILQNIKNSNLNLNEREKNSELENYVNFSSNYENNKTEYNRSENHLHQLINNFEKLHKEKSSSNSRSSNSYLLQNKTKRSSPDA